MKDRYEQRLKELEEERSTADNEREKAEQERDKIQERARRLQMQLSSQPQGGASGPENTRDAVVAEVTARIWFVLEILYGGISANYVDW